MAKILMVGSEAAPWAKTGGLGDVLGALPPALVARGHEVMTLLPAYGNVVPEGARTVFHDLPIGVGPGGTHHCSIARFDHNGAGYLFLVCPGLFGRDGFYGDKYGDFGDNHIRYAVLSRAAFAVATGLWRPDIFHCHDWQGALVPIYQRTTFANDPAFSGIKSVLTIHNLGYQGRFGARLVAETGLIPAMVMHPEGAEYFGDVNFLKGGIVYSDFITTVSPRYAQEIQTPEYGFGLDGLLRSRNYKLSGIVNGVDYSEWNPDHDAYIAAHYSVGDLGGKLVCKQRLLQEVGLPAHDLSKPLIGIVSRFASQKGLDLVAECIAGLADLDIQMVVLGSGDRYLESAFEFFAKARPHQFAFRSGYNNALAHRIEAGADMFLMPSRYEPCGLNQIYSLRYGTIPLVRATGGLDDTINEQTGFKFWGANAGELYACVAHAVEHYRFNRESWREMMRRGMSRDFSWDASAAQYSELYERLLGA